MDEFWSFVLYRSGMETYLAPWTFVMFTLNIFVAIVGFGLIYRSQQQTLEQLQQQAAHQDAIWQ